ncbi:rho GTPase-activating protein 12-like [Tropilaelaps mercedesae]|uniref:Rho GTPase-activating protein 12-like n=1 Tax=Tropilaelaps mercedesae TaxID=418985 RepID=A0A1V9XXM5_9ACAR|nr:rho GTPase-activating protein 12-like [Tropilaelaps mercedesae]
MRNSPFSSRVALCLVDRVYSSIVAPTRWAVFRNATSRSAKEDADESAVLRCQGTLNKADLVKAGKKVQKKNWVCCFLVLTSKNLFVYKDAQTGQQTTPGEGALSRLALPGALIEWCPDKSKRKNCFQVSTVQGQKVLFQDDNVQTSKEWFESIKGCIIHLPLGYDISGEILKARTPQGKDQAGHMRPMGPVPLHNTVARDFSVGTLTKDTLKRSKKVLRSKSIKLLRPSNTLPGSSGSGLGLVAASPGGPGPLEAATGSEKGSTTDLVTLSPNERKRRIGDRLKMFFMRRPTLEMLKEKGIIRDESVFGCSLASLCAREQATVPRFVVRCIDAIENKDMRADGIYRASGNLSQVQKVRFSINMDDYSVLEKEEDVHVLTGALKMFFREMKEPLLTFSLFDRLLDATQIKERPVKLAAFEAILRELPQVNKDTLRFLLEHLLRVKEYSSENRMHIQNLAIVFGPTLLSSADRTSRNIAMDTIQQNQVIEFILVEFDALFC